MRVADMRSIEVRVDVGENDIPKVKLGDTAVVEVDAYTNRKFKGLVYKIANPNTYAQFARGRSDHVSCGKFVTTSKIPSETKNHFDPARKSKPSPCCMNIPAKRCRAVSKESLRKITQPNSTATKVMPRANHTGSGFHRQRRLWAWIASITP